MLHSIAPMPVTSPVTPPGSKTSLSSLALPELPVPQKGAAESSNAARLVAPESVLADRRITPQSVEMALMRRENERMPDRPVLPIVQHNSAPAKTFHTHSYRPAHLSYEGFPAKSAAKRWDDVLWRAVWILCLVFGVFAVIALLAAGYNQL